MIKSHRREIVDVNACIIAVLQLTQQSIVGFIMIVMDMPIYMIPAG